jgi:hypothetical protein
MSQIKPASKVLRFETKLLKKLIVFVFIGGIAAWFLQYLAAKAPTEAQTKRNGPLIVRGYIATTIGGSQDAVAAARIPGKDVFLPGIKVFLVDASTNDDGKPVTTDLSGRFTLLAPKSGRYRVCWKTDTFENGCSKAVVSVSGPVFVSTVNILPDRSDSKERGVIFGNVRLKDGSRARRLEPLQNVNAFAKVSLLDKGGNKIREVFVNNFGEYVIAKVPSKKEITLRAQIENGNKVQRILPEANVGTTLFNPINLIIDNTPPRLEPIVATDGGNVRVKVARPGDRIKLKSRASDKDGDGLIFNWKAADGSGTLSTPNQADTEWQLPAKPGLYSVKLLVWDKKGGYAVSDLSLEAGDGRIRFSGKVDGTDTPAIADAEVEVNGKTTRTDAQGLFNFAVEDAKRFVLNIRKPGYGLVSKIYDDSMVSGNWTMTKASTTRVNPRNKFTVTEERDRRNCPGPEANTLDWGRFQQKGLQPQWQDGKGNIIQPPKRGLIESLLPRQTTYKGNTPKCGPGAKVQIPAGALEDKNRVAATGPVDVSIATIDLRSPQQMPGDYTVITSGGQTRVMESYGAVSIDITGGGKRLNLKPGATAVVTIPVDQAQKDAGGAPPSSIPILFYNERKGVWEEEGTANLVGGNYVATVRHFSNINTDLIKTNQSCVRILSLGLPVNYDLEYTIPSPSGGGAAPIVRRVGIAGSPPHVIYNLPSNVNIVLVPIRQDNNTPIGTFVVNTGGAQAPTIPNLPVAPYTACSTTVTLTDQFVPEPVEEYLQGLYTFEATNLSELGPADAAAMDLATVHYYDQIDPRDKRTTLAQFKTVNGFDTPPDVRASFANSGDLGFGRDMHCKKQLSPTGDGLFDVACYVTNYGNILTPDQDDADKAHDQLFPVATVAMEFSAVENPLADPTEFTDLERVVKFYVYNAAGDALLNSADLDSGVNLRPRPIPQLCMVCHNGVYPGGVNTGVPVFASRNDTKMGARFLPFDTHFYTFPALNPKAAQQAAIKDLNDLVKLTHTQEPGSISATNAIADMIDGMYTPPPPLPEQDENFVVSGWNSQPIRQGMYKDVIARTCRTCHVANIFGTAAPGSLPLVFDQSSQFIDVLGKAESRVCVQHVMPHARVPHSLFWTSTGPSMPAQFQVFGDTFDSVANGWNGTLCGSFTPGGGTPLAFYTTDIQPIWDGVGTGTTACTACHVGGASAPEGLDLSAGVSYGNIFNVNSTELPSMKRVRPSDAANSYLFHKINGTHGGLAGCPSITSCFGGPSAPCGARMPCSGGPMNAASITKIQTWINSGALGP